jgi:transposase InsO family protein
VALRSDRAVSGFTRPNVALTRSELLRIRYLATVLDDFSRYIVAWKLCSTMRAEDVTDTLNMALTASGCDQAHVRDKPRLLSDNGPSYIAGELADLYPGSGHEPRPGRSNASPDPGQDRALAPDPQEPHPVGELLPAR